MAKHGDVYPLYSAKLLFKHSITSQNLQNDFPFNKNVSLNILIVPNIFYRHSFFGGGEFSKFQSRKEEASLTETKMKLLVTASNFLITTVCCPSGE